MLDYIVTIFVTDSKNVTIKNDRTWSSYGRSIAGCMLRDKTLVKSRADERKL